MTGRRSFVLLASQEASTLLRSLTSHGETSYPNNTRARLTIVYTIIQTINRCEYACTWKCVHGNVESEGCSYCNGGASSDCQRAQVNS